MTVTLRVRLVRLTANSGDVIDVPESGVTCIVGGNNVGKSQLLRDIVASLQDSAARPVALSAIEVTGRDRIDEATAEAWLKEVATPVQQGPGYPVSYSPIYGGTTLRPDLFAFTWNYETTLSTNYSFFCWHATAGSLGGWASATISFDTFRSGGQPLARIFRDGSLDQELSMLCKEAFGFPLTFDRINGQFRYRVGEPGIPAPAIDNPDVAYADALLEMQPLETQGDGVKSFLGLAVNIVAGSAQVMLIDEPEAFLHPAQSRALGRWLAKQSLERDRQVLVATHDRDFVLGLLDSDSPVKIVRVHRESDTTLLRQLEAEEVAAVWAEPVLRYSNILQGLFHRRVIVCESDADCRFYGAVLDVLATERGTRSMADDTLFVPSGGKDRAAKLTNALDKVGVAAHAILDFDALRKRETVRSLVEAAGQTWTSQMNDRYVELATQANQNDGWRTLKEQGLNGLRGSVRKSASEFLYLLANVRVHVLPVGEMEDFEKSIGTKGGAWVSEMLERGEHATNAAAREFMARFADEA